MTSRTHVSQMPKKMLWMDWLNKEKGPFTQWLHCPPTALITELVKPDRVPDGVLLE